MNSAAPVSAVPETSQSAQPEGHSVIEAAWARFRVLAQAEQKEELVADLASVMERFALGIFRLVVMGEIKKG